MAGKSATERQIDDLNAYIAQERLNDPAFRAQFRALNPGAPLPETQPGLAAAPLPGSDAQNPLTGDEAGPATTDANGITAVDARDVESGADELDALNVEVARLQQATRDRRAAEALKTRQPETDQAIRQQGADQLNAAIGRAQRFSNRAQRGVRNQVFGLADRLGAVSTPGGISALLIILVLLLLVLIPVNGQPRLVWAWLVLTGKARLMSAEKADALGSGTVGITEPAPTHSEVGSTQTHAQTGAQEPVTHATYANPLSSGTPVNVSLNGSLSGLGRYINP